MFKRPENTKLVCQNRKARHDYHIEDAFEAGMVLKGTEVKALRMGRANIKDSYARIKKGELFLHQFHVSEYPFSFHDNHEPLRVRKLLMHSREIKRLTGKIQERGFSLIPLEIYFSKGKAKVTLALVRGKRKYDKRQDIRKREEKREMDRAKKDRDRDY